MAPSAGIDDFATRYRVIWCSQDKEIAFHHRDRLGESQLAPALLARDERLAFKKENSRLAFG